MEATANIACIPKPWPGQADRFSFNFCTVQLTHYKFLKWHIISRMKDDTDKIRFNVKEQGPLAQNLLRFKDIQDKSITPYVPYRNLYIADVENATGHFIVRVEPVEA